MASNRKNVPLSSVIQQLTKDRIEFFVNSLLKPVVRIPDDPYQQHWELTHERFLAHVSAVYHDLTNDYLRTADRDMLIELLKEECYKGGRRPTELESELIDKEAIVQAVVLFLSTINKDFDGMTRDLLAELRKDAIQDRITPPDPDFPVLTNIFTRRFNRLVPALRGLGVEGTITHAEDGSHCKLIRLPNFKAETDAMAKEPSAKPSDVSADTANGTVPPDGSDGSDGRAEKDHPFLTGDTNKPAA